MTQANALDTIVLVTGGASGVGRVIADSFIEDGAAVHICDSSANEIESFLGDNPGASATLCDVSDSAQVASVFRDLETKYAGLHVLINNAGIAGPTAMAEDISVDEWRRCIAVNLDGVFYFARQAIPIFKNQGDGVIINIASNAGLFGCPNRSPYVAGKWAIIGLTKTWAMELGPHNIRVNAICPASVEGARIENVIEQDAARRGLTNSEIRDVYQRQSSMRTFVTAEDIANMIIFLASEKAAKISGQAIAVDGHTETLSNWLEQQ